MPGTMLHPGDTAVNNLTKTSRVAVLLAKIEIIVTLK